MVKSKDMFKNNYTYVIGLSVGTILVVILLSFFVIKPLIGKAKSLNQEVTDKKTELTALEDKKSKLDKLKDKEDELKADGETVKNALPDNKDAGRLFIQIDKLAKETGGTVKSISEEGDAATSSGAVSTTATGLAGIQKITYNAPIDFNSYFSFKDFLVKSESALRLTNIDNFSISTNDSGILSVDLNFTTYARGK